MKLKLSKKLIIILIVIVVLIVTSIIVLPKVIKTDSVSTRVTTHTVQEITYGSVTETISGSGNLSAITKDTKYVTKSGTVKKVYFEVGDTVEEDDLICVIGSVKYYAPYDGILLELPISVGESVNARSEAYMIMGLDGFTITISVDETEISEVKIGQAVTFTLDTKTGSYEGEVTEISYNGSQSGNSVSYKIGLELEYIEGVYPGMSVTAQIVIEDSGEGLLVPVDSVKTSGDTKYVYLAPSDSTKGDTYSEDELDLTKLTKVTVETGMSDGSYILVTSDELKEGDLIILTKITSTVDSSQSDDSKSDFMDMGNMPGGNMDFNPSDLGGDSSKGGLGGGVSPNFGG